MSKPRIYPSYVRLRKFVVVTDLLPLISTLTEEQQRNYCFIVSMIIRLTHKKPSFFLNIHHKVWNNFIGDNYSDYIHQLEVWRIIELNHSFCHEGEVSFSKGYRLHSSVVDSEKVTKAFAKKRVKPLKDQSQLVNPVCHFVHTNLKKVTVLETLTQTTNNVEEVECEEWAEKIYWDQFNLKYGHKVSRMYHSIILMPKASRKNLLYKDDHKVQLFEYDVKSCHPVLLMSMITSPSEKERFKKVLDTDIYTTIAKEMGVTKDRELIKDDFMFFINGEVKNYFHTFFKEHFPMLSEQIAVNGKSMASISQNMEAGIMVRDLPTLMMEQHQGYFYVPMHDGWMGLERDEQAIGKMVSDLFFSVTGYRITITKKNLTTGIETYLVK